jgi:hypothetical protein
MNLGASWREGPRYREQNYATGAKNITARQGDGRAFGHHSKFYLG